MHINIQTQIPKKNNFLVLPIFEDENLSLPSDLFALKKLIEARQNNKDFNAKAGQTLILYPDTANLPQSVLLFGFGKKKNIKGESARNHAAHICKAVKQHKKEEVALYLPRTLEKYSQEIAEGITLANYNPNLYQTGKAKIANNKKTIKKLEVVIAESKAKKEIEKKNKTGLALAEAVNYTRDLVNAPNNIINPDTLAREAKKLAKETKCKVTILDKKHLEKLKMGALLGVNKGSKIEAKMVIFEYKPAGAKKEQPILLVGKGITFDSGGYNLKPTQGITNMKEDMAGAATVFGVFKALKDLNIKKHIIGITPLTENMIGSSAQAVNDVITTYSGLTVEVTNTDAEGRLVLADAVNYGVKKFKPKYVIDLATLTGACMVALGDRYAGLFSNNNALAEALKKAGEETGDLVWQLPIHADFRKKMKGKIADLINSEGSGLAGASKGAAFIEFFIEKTAWAHLDIAGVAFVKDPRPYDPDCATGFGVRLLAKFLE
jgi:leucyl aminopeptidase